jgi:uncharacterized protein
MKDLHMADESLKDQLTAQMKEAMRAKDKERLGAIRLILAEFKRIEVDERPEGGISDERALTVLDKMVKQRRDSIEQFTQAGRTDLVGQEEFELGIIQGFMPQPLSSEEVDAFIDSALSDSGAQSIKDMGKVMGLLKPKMQGRTDMGKVSTKIKERLNALSS